MYPISQCIENYYFLFSLHVDWILFNFHFHNWLEWCLSHSCEIFYFRSLRCVWPLPRRSHCILFSCVGLQKFFGTMLRLNFYIFIRNPPETDVWIIQAIWSIWNHHSVCMCTMYIKPKLAYRISNTKKDYFDTIFVCERMRTNCVEH